MVKRIEECPPVETQTFPLADEEVNHKEEPRTFVSLKNVNYSIHQKDSDILIVFAYIKQIRRECLRVVFHASSFVVEFQTEDARLLSSYNVEDNQETWFQWRVTTRHEISPSNCYFKLTPSCLELTLVKLMPAKWDSLEELPPSIRTNIIPLSLAPAKLQDKWSDKSKEEDEDGEEEEMVPPRKSPAVTPGLVGLENLGNTCFMNSVLQCLSSVADFRNFFLSGRYKVEINRSNPLGTGGKLAYAFADLLRVMWQGKGNLPYFSPSKLKTLIGWKASQFSGFAQHDAQELMTFLLDGLHEDLNRVKQKPYGETVESEGKSDERIAEESWKIHKNRNNSVVTDLFHGQYKSKLVCPACSKVSITFDPFLCLSVPLPKKLRYLTVYFFSRFPERKPLKLFVKVTYGAAVEELKEAVASKTGTRPKNLKVVEVFKHKIHKTFERGSVVTAVNPSDHLFVFELLDKEAVGEPVVELAVVQRIVMPKPVVSCSNCNKDNPLGAAKLRRCTKCLSVGYCNEMCQRSHWGSHRKFCQLAPELVGQPFVFSLPRSQCTLENICHHLHAYSKYSVDLFQPPVDKLELNMSELDLKGAEEALLCSGGDNGLDTHFHIRLLTSPDPQHLGALLTPEMLLGEGQPTFLQLAQDWRNNNRTKQYVLVQTKKLSYDAPDGEEPPLLDENREATLDQCLQLFTEPEVLSPNEAWYCPSCKDHREATKRLSVWRLPHYLIIQLKRFSFKNYLWRDKIDKMVTYPVRGLDMSPYYCGSGKEDLTYDLMAVVNHHGGILGGHYTAFTRPYPHSAGWYKFDDSHVGPLPDKYVMNRDAYLLFYCRRNVPIDSNLLQDLLP